MIQLIVFLPLIAALIAGLGGRWIGNFAAKAITTGALFAAAALSWPIFLNFVSGDYSGGWLEPVSLWFTSCDLAVNWALRVDALTAVMLAGVTRAARLV